MTSPVAQAPCPPKPRNGAAAGSPLTSLRFPLPSPRERLITNTYPYHILKDSPKGAKLDHELEQELYPPNQRTDFVPPADYGYDPAKGFVTERQLRVSAATLAYGNRDEEPIRHPDQTKTNRSHIRVASGFTVESDSPYRSIRPGEENGTTPPQILLTRCRPPGSL